MTMNRIIPRCLLLLAGCACLITTAYADTDDVRSQQVEPITDLINFQIKGVMNTTTSATGPVYYTVGGPGYAPPTIFPNGEVSDAIVPKRQVVTLKGAQITFTGAPTDAIVKFTCLPGSCEMDFKDGSRLVSNAGVQLQGRAINMWGPVYKNPAYVPNRVLPIRILGCGGLKEVAGKGRFANMVGSVCFNGVLNFNLQNRTVLSGSSKCTITMHTPINPSAIQ